MRAMRAASIAAAAVAVGALGCGDDTVVSVESGSGDDRIRVSGTATVEARPDLARAAVGVTSFHADAVQAVTDNNQRAAAVTTALESLGIVEEDLRTTGFSISPQRDFRKDRPDTITGYWVNNALEVTIRDLGGVGAILQAAIDAGANEVFGLRFTVANPDSLEDVARQRAVADARRRAEVLAEAAGVQVGDVISLIESSVSVPPFFRGGFEADEAASVPVQPGQVEITARVEAVFAIR